MIPITRVRHPVPWRWSFEILIPFSGWTSIQYATAKEAYDAQFKYVSTHP